MAPSMRRKEPGSGSDELRRVRDRELELKRMSGEISCADCRRLKLKCDKKIPCSSCKRRGAESMCPLGAVRGSSGQSARTALAGSSRHYSQRIARKSALLSERIRALEDALAVESEARGGSGSHPLLAEDLLAIKRCLDDDKDESEDEGEAEQVLSTFGTLSIGESRTMRYFGPAGSESVLVMEVLENNPSRRLPITGPSISSADNISPEIICMSDAFPFSPLNLNQNKHCLMEQLVTHLPPFERATALYEAFFGNLSWFVAPIERSQFISEIVPLFYPHRKPIVSTNVREEHAHELALLFIVFANGSVGDLTQSPINDEAERYYTLAKASMSVKSIMQGASLTGVQVTYLLAAYDMYSGRKSNLEDAWKLFGLGGIMASAIGLHRDPSRWGLEPKMIERRRRIFWEIYEIDTWRSLESDRPSLFRPSVVDCEFPSDQGASIGENGEIVESVVQWRYRFLRDVTVEYREKMCSARPLKYRDILELDRKIRDFPAHPFAVRHQSTCSLGIDTEFSRIYPLLTTWDKEESLSYIHRNLFARAILDFPDNPMRSPFAASFLATYRSAVAILRLCRENMEDMYLVVLRIWQLWSTCLSCGVIVGAVASLGSSVSFATSAFVELEYAIALFEKYNGHKVAKHGLPLFRRIREKAVNALHRPRKRRSTADGTLNQRGGIPSIRSECGDVDEELLILHGTTRVIEQRGRATSIIKGSAATSPGIVGEVKEMTESTNESAGLHPDGNIHGNTDASLPEQSIFFERNEEDIPSGSNSAHSGTSPYIPCTDAWLAELEEALGSYFDSQRPDGGAGEHQQGQNFEWTGNYLGSSMETPDLSSAMGPSSSHGKFFGTNAAMSSVLLEQAVNTEDWTSFIQQSGFSSTPPFDFPVDADNVTMRAEQSWQSTTPLFT